MLVIAWLVAVSRAITNDALSVSALPGVAQEPAQVTVRVFVEPDPENRALELTAESENFSSGSRVQLDGDRSPRTRVFEYRNLPAGNYDFRAVLIDRSGNPGSIAIAKVHIVARAL
jgi:hypothetical protein